MAVDFVALKHAQKLDHLSTLHGTYLGENKSNGNACGKLRRETGRELLVCHRARFFHTQ